MNSKNARWYGTITLFLIVAVSYIDRINIAVLITDLDFLTHIGLAQSDRVAQGSLATAFMVGYGVSSVILTPFAAALLGVRKSLILGLIFWGVVTFVSPWMESYGLLLASRILLGISEGPVFSLASAYIKAHFESHENGKPNSIVNMGTGLGLALGYPFIAFLIASHSWENSFHVLGVLNILLGIPLVLAFIHMPATELSGAGSPLQRVKTTVVSAFQTRHLFAITLLTAAFLSYLWGSSNWLPAYLKEARGFTMRDMGWLASLPQYAAVLAVFVGGLLIDKLDRRNVPLIFVGGAIGVALSVAAAIGVQDRYAAAGALIAANFFWGSMSASIPSTVQHFASPQNIASAYGFVNGVASLIAGFMPAIMGKIIASVAEGNPAAGAGFAAGFGVLIGTQVVVALVGLYLYVMGRQSDPADPALSGAKP